MLRAAQEHEEGLANISPAQLEQVFANNHILVRNDTNLRVWPYRVMGYAQADSKFDFRLSNVNRRLNVFTGQKRKVYKHWFRHCVLQQGAQPGEVVPAAITGLTFAMVRTPFDTPSQLSIGCQVALEDGDITFGGWEYNGFYQLGSASVGRYGHAQVMRTGEQSGIITSNACALVELQKLTPVWRATLTNRVSTTEFDAVLPDYSAQGPTGTIKVLDPQNICPDTTVIPTGATSIPALIEIFQPSLNTNDKSELPDIAGVLINVSAATTRDGLQTEDAPPP